jgi:hypothetical protein
MLLKFDASTASVESLYYDFDNIYKPINFQPVVLIIDCSPEVGQDLITILFKSNIVREEIIASSKSRELALFLVRDEDSLFANSHVFVIFSSYLKSSHASWLNLFLSTFTIHFVLISLFSRIDELNLSDIFSNATGKVRLEMLVFEEKSTTSLQKDRLHTLLKIQQDRQAISTFNTYSILGGIDIFESSQPIKKIMGRLQVIYTSSPLNRHQVVMESLFIEQLKISWKNLYMIPRNSSFETEFKRSLDESTAIFWKLTSLELKQQCIEQVNKLAESYLVLERPSDAKDFLSLIDKYFDILFDPFTFNSTIASVKVYCEEYSRKLILGFIGRYIKQSKRRFTKNINLYLSAADFHNDKIIGNIEAYLTEQFELLDDSISFLPGFLLEANVIEIKRWKEIQSITVKQFYIKTMTSQLCKAFLEKEKERFKRCLTSEILHKNLYFSIFVEARLDKFETKFDSHFRSIIIASSTFDINVAELKQEIVKDMLELFRTQIIAFYTTHRDQIFNNFGERIHNPDGIEDFVENFITFVSKKHFFTLYGLQESQFYYFLNEPQIEDFRKGLRSFIEYKNDHKLEFLYQNELKADSKFKLKNPFKLREKISGLNLSTLVEPYFLLHVFAVILLVVVVFF